MHYAQHICYISFRNYEKSIKCLSSFLLLEQKTIQWAIYKEQKFVTFGFWKVQIKRLAGSMSREGSVLLDGLF
jgi:hypothetical protein